MVSYHEAGGRLNFTWEFGGGDTVAIIYVGNEARWRERHAWAVERRSQILRRTADEVIRQKSPTSRAEIDEEGGWINIRSARPDAGALPSLHRNPD